MARWACSVGLVLSLFVLCAGRTSAEDKVVGRIWQITFEAKDSKNNQVRKFRATPDGKIWNMPEKETPKQIGTWEGNEDKSTMDISVRGESGKYEMVLVGKDPMKWDGTFQDEKGKKRPIKVKLLKD